MANLNNKSRTANEYAKKAGVNLPTPDQLFDIYSTIEENKKKEALAKMGLNTPVERAKRDVSNAKHRLNFEGVNPDKDERNWFEKLTNLPEDQNAFFDALDLLQRPLYGYNNIVKRGADEMKGMTQDERLEYAKKPLEPKEMLGDFWEGFSGNKRVIGSDILESSGVEGKVAKNIGGLAWDIGVDPINAVSGAPLAKGIGAVAKPVKEGLSKIPGADALGHMFKPYHKMDETIDGNKSDELVDSFKDYKNEMNYRLDKSKEHVINTARKHGGLGKGDEVGRVMEETASKVVRDMGNDLDVFEAARKLTRSNDYIVNLARANGIDMGKIDGYMAHVLTEEAKKLKKKGKLNDSGLNKVGGNRDVVRSRKYEGSAEDVNASVGNKLFRENAYEATVIGQKRALEYILAEGFKNRVLKNNKFAVPLDKASDALKTRDDLVELNTRDYKFLKTDTGFKEVGENQKFLVTKGAKKALDNFSQKINDEGVHSFIKGYDKVHQTWKKFALFSTGFHIRNQIGNNFNMWIAGMGPKALPKFNSKAVEEIYQANKKGKNIREYEEFRRQGLKGTSVYDDITDNAEKSLAKELKQGQRGPIKKLFTQSPFESSRKIGASLDEVSRYAMFKWAKSKGMSSKEAADKVRQTLFDYDELTQFERNMKRVVPFYTWIRKNAPYQLYNLATQPAKYTGLEKTRQAIMDKEGIDSEAVPEWLNNSLALPLNGGENGDGTFLGANLPASDLAGMAENPLKYGINSVTPLAKILPELALNRNFFYNSPIQNFEGEKKDIFGGALEVNPKVKHVMDQLGAVRNLSGVSDKMVDNLKNDQDKQFDPKDLINILTSNMVKDVDAQKQRDNKVFEERDKLREMMELFEQDNGRRPLTKAQIKELEELGLVK